MPEPGEGQRGDLELGTIPRLVRVAAERHAELAAVVDDGVTLTFTELAAEVKRAARALMAVGIAPGDRVALWAPNGWEWVVAALAVHAAGAALVPINTRWKGGRARDDDDVDTRAATSKRKAHAVASSRGITRRAAWLRVATAASRAKLSACGSCACLHVD